MMRGTKNKKDIAYKRDVVGALALIPGVMPGSDVTDLAGVWVTEVTLTWTADTAADHEICVVNLDGAGQWVALGTEVESPFVPSVTVAGDHEFAIISHRPGGYRHSSNIAEVTIPVAVAVTPGTGDDPCENLPAQGANKSALLDWLASAGITIDDPSNFTKNELWSLITDACD